MKIMHSTLLQPSNETAARSVVQHLQHADQQLKNILYHVKLLDQLQAKVIKLLPTELSSQCQVTNYQQGSLVLLVNNGSTATQLRFQLPQILSKLRSEANMPGLANIKILVRPSRQIYSPSPRQAKLSTNSEKILQEILAITAKKV